MDTFASLLTDTMVDKLISHYSKYKVNDIVYYKCNQKYATVINVVYDEKHDNIVYDIICNGTIYYNVPENILSEHR